MENKEPLAQNQAPVTASIQSNLTLKCVGGVLNGKSCPISGGISIGSDAALCNVVYPKGEPGISGVHCKITSANGQAQLIDTESSAGTFINGVPILPNMPYSIPVGGSFCVGSPNNVFIVAEEASRPKKRLLPIVLIGAAVLLLAAVITVFLLIKNAPAYTGITGTAFAMPEAGFANFALDGVKQTGTARTRNDVGGYGYPAEKMFSVSLGTDRFVAWYFNSLPTPWVEETSVPFSTLSDIDQGNWIGTNCDGTNIYYSLGEYAEFENCGSFEDASLTLLELNGDEITFYFYVSMTNFNGESHILEGVAHAVPDSSSSETYTGVTGKTFAIPDVGYANLAFDGREQEQNETYYGVKGEGDGPRLNERMLDITLEDGIFTEWGYIQWDFDESRLRWEPGASFELQDITDRSSKNSLSLSCNDIHYYSYSGEFDEATLNVLSLDGDEITFYFYVKTNKDGESHTLEGVGRAVLMPVT